MLKSEGEQIDGRTNTGLKGDPEVKSTVRVAVQSRRTTAIFNYSVL